MADGDIIDSPSRWVAEHIRRYVESDGERGHEWRGVRTLLLTTRGRTTGRLHRTALIYGQDGDRCIVVASAGGSPTHPNWYRNLLKNPEVGVQVGAEQFTARARPAEGEERTRLWQQMAEIWPDYDNYQKRADRQIPVVILERV